MRSLKEILRGIVLASTPLVGLQGCSGAFCGSSEPQVDRYSLSAEEYKAASAFISTSELQPTSRLRDGGWPDVSCDTLCRSPDRRDGGISSHTLNPCRLATNDDGSPAIECQRESFACEGRRPESFVQAEVDASSDVGVWLANMAQLEAASVPAFQRLRAELLAHDAPESLVRATERAIRDERRHTHAVGLLAESHGGRWMRRKLDAMSVRTLEEIAIENAVEGCVRETYGALQALWRGEHARDPDVRATMQAIAEDEVRHAELAWAVDAWVFSRLTGEAQQRVQTAREHAVCQLEAELRHAPPAAVIEQLGVPDARMSAVLFDAMRSQVWAGGVA